MEILDGDIRQATCDRVAWAAAVQAFTGHDLARDDHVAEWGWIAAGMFDEHDHLKDDWRQALTSVTEATNRGVMFSRYNNVGYIVEWCNDGERIVTSTTSCDIIADQLSEDAFCQIHLGRPNDAWPLLSRALPPGFKIPTSQPAVALDIGLDTSQLPADPAAAWAVLQDSFATDPVVTAAEEASQSVSVTALVGDEENSFSWFLAADQTASAYRIGPDGVFQVGTDDVRKTVEPLIFATVVFDEIDVEEEPPAKW